MKVTQIEVGSDYQIKTWAGTERITVTKKSREDNVTGFGYMRKTTKVWVIEGQTPAGIRRVVAPNQVVQAWDPAIDEAAARREEANRFQSIVVDRINAVTDYTIQASIPFDRHSHARGYGVDVRLTPAKAARLAELLEENPNLLG